MRKEKFSKKEERKIEIVEKILIEERQPAIDALRTSQYSHLKLAHAVGLKGGSRQDKEVAAGRTSELADEAIRRAQKRIE